MNKWKTTLISLVISILFALASFFMPNQINLFWSLVVCILTFIITFVFVELLEHIKKIENYDINNQYQFFKECGISEYKNDFTTIDFASCISGANHIKIVLQYSNRFLKDYINVLRDFVAREGSTLEFIILSNNKNSDSYKYISAKFDYGKDKLGEKINDFENILRNDLLLHKNTRSKIEISFAELIPAYTLYMFDDYAYITLYKTAPQRTNLVPCFRVEKAYDSSFFNFMLNDFNDIKKQITTKTIFL